MSAVGTAWTGWASQVGLTIPGLGPALSPKSGDLDEGIRLILVLSRALVRFPGLSPPSLLVFPGRWTNTLSSPRFQHLHHVVPGYKDLLFLSILRGFGAENCWRNFFGKMGKCISSVLGGILYATGVRLGMSRFLFLFLFLFSFFFNPVFPPNLAFFSLFF